MMVAWRSLRGLGFCVNICEIGRRGDDQWEREGPQMPHRTAHARAARSDRDAVGTRCAPHAAPVHRAHRRAPCERPTAAASAHSRVGPHVTGAVLLSVVRCENCFGQYTRARSILRRAEAPMAPVNGGSRACGARMPHRPCGNGVLRPSTNHRTIKNHDYR